MAYAGCRVEESRVVERLEQQPSNPNNKAKSIGGSFLQIHIDEVQENRESGYVEILYSHTALAQKIAYRELSAPCAARVT